MYGFVCVVLCVSCSMFGWLMMMYVIAYVVNAGLVILWFLYIVDLLLCVCLLYVCVLLSLLYVFVFDVLCFHCVLCCD